MIQVTTIYNLAGYTLADGFQSSLVCDAAYRAARMLACSSGRSVVVEDVVARQCYRVTPKRSPLAPASGLGPGLGFQRRRRAMIYYAVVQPDGPNRAIVISRHLTYAAAVAAIEKETARFARSPYGRSGAYLDREITVCERGATRAVRGLEV